MKNRLITATVIAIGLAYSITVGEVKYLAAAITIELIVNGITYLLGEHNS